MRIPKFLESMIKKESEKVIEAYLVAETRKRGGIAYKLTSQFHRGMPDRLVLLPYHTLCFVELKSTGEKTTPLQDAAIHQIQSMKFAVRVVDSIEGVDKLMADLDRRIQAQIKDAEMFNSRVEDLKREMKEYRRNR